MWIFALSMLVLWCFVAPLLPALVEMFWPTDVAPLRVVPAYDNNPLHFAQGFQKYIDTHSAPLFGDHDHQSHKNGALPDGTPFHFVGVKGVPHPEDMRDAGLIVSSHPMTMPGDMLFGSEIYSGRDITVGDNSHLRAALAKDTLTIGENSTVLRWAHSGGDLRVKPHATLFGRVTSGTRILLSDGCQFERLHAPEIRIGNNYPAPVTPPVLTLLENLANVRSKAGRRHLLDGDLEFPAYHRFDGDIVAGSTAIVGEHAHIAGSLKSNSLNDVRHYLRSSGVMAGAQEKIACCEIGDHVQIDGAVVSTHDLYIGMNCRIGGPVIAENLMIIRSGTVIGSPEYPCTVTAPEIVIETGCVIFGTLWATRKGIVEHPVPSHAREVAV